MDVKRYKIALGVLILSASVATAQANNKPGVNYSHPKFTIRLEAPYYKSSYEDTIFASKTTTTGIDPALTNVESWSISPSRDWGFGIAGSAAVPGDNAINGSYTHLKLDDRMNFSGGNFNLEGISPAVSVDQGYGSISIKYDAGDVTAEHDFMLGDAFGLDVFAGIRIATVDRNFDRYGTMGTLVYSTMDRSDFTGYGPELGFRGTSWFLPRSVPRLNFQGEFKIADLYGERKYSHTEVNVNNDLIPVTTNTRPEDEDIFVPFFGVRLSINYDIPIGNGDDVGIGIGYDHQNYLDVVKNASTNNTSNVGFSGIFLTADYKFR